MDGAECGYPVRPRPSSCLAARHRKALSILKLLREPREASGSGAVRATVVRCRSSTDHRNAFRQECTLRRDTIGQRLSAVASGVRRPVPIHPRPGWPYYVRCKWAVKFRAGLSLVLGLDAAPKEAGLISSQPKKKPCLQLIRPTWLARQVPQMGLRSTPSHGRQVRRGTRG